MLGIKPTRCVGCECSGDEARVESTQGQGEIIRAAERSETAEQGQILPARIAQREMPHDTVESGRVERAFDKVWMRRSAMADGELFDQVLITPPPQPQPPYLGLQGDPKTCDAPDRNPTP